MKTTGFGINWFFVAIFFPILIGIFKNEIGKLFTSWSIYRLRAYDSDGDPSTPSAVQLFNNATGLWFTVTIRKYVLFTRKAKRGVHIQYADGARRKFSFLDWDKEPKRSLPVTNKIP